MTDYLLTPYIHSEWTETEIEPNQGDTVLLSETEAQNFLADNPRLRSTIEGLAKTIAELDPAVRQEFVDALPQDLRVLLAEWAELNQSGDAHNTQPDFTNNAKTTGVNLSEQNDSGQMDEAVAAWWVNPHLTAGESSAPTGYVTDDGSLLANPFPVENAKYRPSIALSEQEAADEDAFVEHFRGMMY